MDALRSNSVDTRRRSKDRSWGTVFYMANSSLVQTCEGNRGGVWQAWSRTVVNENGDVVVVDDTEKKGSES